ncbi:MATE efflux family protein [Streptococcus urinalis FB127-CNA-2]|uniref:Probable multidrug resistance protein NorM n=1 Tax=Streptococcus urinalis 2285-97 TaxID=764291 RepID=G5KH76_9STRE|nr:MATE family efflux transporter [Streptococcus urinalis]EHJ56405.1 MATE efflux family protein [Streptococcus urinalis 2285-97]EKS21058.1 MATE efflux family protein [Streptococcus urinalis FB127-CNA-2]VEF31067.1 MATE family efflux protein [Streptococcus urinalis]
MHDLTKGNPLKVILWFTIPLLIGSFFQLTYNFADSIIVGHTLGKNAFASVGATGSITFLILGFAEGLTSGLTIITSHKFGANDPEDIKKSFVHGLFYAMVTALVLTILALTFLRPLLEIMQTPKHLISSSYSFLSAIFGGMIFTILFNFFSSAIRALGNSKTPLIALIIACLINIVLDFIFILHFHLGVFGAGFATVIAQAFSVIYLMIYINYHIPYFKLSKKDLKLDHENLKNHARLGFPMAFQASIIAIGAIILQVTLNHLGTNAIAAQAIASKTDQLAMLPMLNLGLAISTYTAQNYGAKKYDRILSGLRKTLTITILWSIVFAILLISFNQFFSGLFLTSGSTQVFALALRYYIINGSCYWILAILFILRSFVQGLGHGFVPTLAGIMELVMRALVAVIGLIYFGFDGVAAANPAAWIGSILVLVPSTTILIKKLNTKNNLLK